MSLSMLSKFENVNKNKKNFKFFFKFFFSPSLLFLHFLQKKIKNQLDMNEQDGENENELNVDFFIKLLGKESSKNLKQQQHQPNYFTNKKIRNYHFKNNFLYRLITCWKTYIYLRLENPQKKSKTATSIWNYDKETTLLTSYLNYCTRVNMESPVCDNKFIFLYQFFDFCENDKHIKDICFLIADSNCQNFFCNNIKKLTSYFQRTQINKFNRKDIINVIEVFCNNYINKMISSHLNV